MVLISLVCSNMVANIIKIFETCKLFWPASEDFVNFATVFVNSATPRGRAPGPPRLSFSLAQRKELKETFPQPRPSPEGRMQPLLLVALYTKVRLGIIALAWLAFGCATFWRQPTSNTMLKHLWVIGARRPYRI